MLVQQLSFQIEPSFITICCDPPTFCLFFPFQKSEFLILAFSKNEKAEGTKMLDERLNRRHVVISDSLFNSRVNCDGPLPHCVGHLKRERERAINLLAFSSSRELSLRRACQSCSQDRPSLEVYTLEVLPHPFYSSLSRLLALS